MKRDARRGGLSGIDGGGAAGSDERRTARRMRTEAFAALLETGTEEGLPRTGLAAPGEASTFIAMLSLAGGWDNSIDAGGDPRLR